MAITDVISNPAGLYALTGDAQLGFFDENGAFLRDEALSAALGALAREFLKNYLAQPDQGRARVAVIGAARAPREWGQVSLFLEESVVRELYPQSGGGGLTAFQKKNQEKSIYRGMELLLEFRNMQYPNAPLFAPVLFDRRLTLDAYPGAGECVSTVNARAPAVEVLNLVAPVPIGRRESAVFVNLKERLHAALIRKDQRRVASYDLVEDTRAHWEAVKAAPREAFTVDTRAEREVTLSAGGLLRLHQTQRIERVERWLEMPHRPVTPGRLREFVHFRALAPAALEKLAATALLYTAPAGARLLERGMTDEWNMYLLEGVVTLEPEQGATLTVEGRSPKAVSPVAFLKPRKYTVTALSKVSFLWIHDLALRSIGVV